MTEQEIRRYLRQMKEEDSQIALKKFYDLCYDRFFRIAYYYLHSEASAQEVVLDVFFKIWQTRESLHQIANLEDYFFILIRNAALNRRERDSHIPETINSVPEPSQYDPAEHSVHASPFNRYPATQRVISHVLSPSMYSRPSTVATFSPATHSR